MSKEKVKFTETSRQDANDNHHQAEKVKSDAKKSIEKPNNSNNDK